METGERRSVLGTYLDRVRAFTVNARLFLLSLLFFGVAGGISQLLFNFYVLSLGYNETTIGNLVTARSITSLIAALPMGYLVDHFGWDGGFVLLISACLLAIAFMIPTLRHKNQASEERAVTAPA